MTIGFVLAALAAAITCAIHVVSGGRFIARPLLDARDIRRVPKLTNYYCWHMVSITIAVMAAGFGWAAVEAAAWPLALALTVLAAAFTVLSLGLVLGTGTRPHLMPQWALFAVVAAFGAWGLWG
jgi:hypothetical protein